MERQVADMLRFDCYGKLLTARQQRLYRLYYCENYSLAEIAAALRITRQAVSDLLRRTRARLRRYDAALGLAAAARRRQAAGRGNGIQRLREGQWEQYFAGREQLFYRGGAAAPGGRPRAGAPAGGAAGNCRGAAGPGPPPGDGVAICWTSYRKNCRRYSRN